MTSKETKEVYIEGNQQESAIAQKQESHHQTLRKYFVITLVLIAVIALLVLVQTGVVIAKTSDGGDGAAFQRNGQRPYLEQTYDQQANQRQNNQQRLQDGSGRNNGMGKGRNAGQGLRDGSGHQSDKGNNINSGQGLKDGTGPRAQAGECPYAN